MFATQFNWQASYVLERRLYIVRVSCPLQHCIALRLSYGYVIDVCDPIQLASFVRIGTQVIYSQNELPFTALHRFKVVLLLCD